MRTATPGPVATTMRGNASVTARGVWPLACLATLLLGVLPGGAARAEEPEAAGRFVAVPPTLSGEAVNRIHQAVLTEFNRFMDGEKRKPLNERRPFKAVFDFNPDGQPQRSENFDLCRLLSSRIQDLQEKGVRTIAFIHGDVTGHAVLPALTCQQIVMSGKAKLGPVRDGGPPLAESEVKTYLERGRRFPEALVRKLFEPALVVVKSKNNEFVPEGHPDALAADRKVFEAGKAAVYTFAKAKEVGLCELDPRDSREALADAYRLPRESLLPHPLLSGKDVVAWQLPLSGEVNGAMKEGLERRLGDALAARATLIVLELRCHGGDTATANDIAQMLASLNQKRADTPVLTVAYITESAGDTATYLALGCDLIVMHDNAKLGDFGRLLEDESAQQRASVADGLEELARQRYYPPVLVRAFADTGGEAIYYVASAKGGHEWDIMTGTQLDAERNNRPGHWHPGESVPLEGGFLTLNAEQARRFGLAHATASDLPSLYALYGVEQSDVRVAGDDWLDELADFLRRPWTSFILVMIGITCLFLELKLPGIGLPGVVAALCFVLYFWAHSQLGGQVTWLAILLFLLGLVLIGIEIFVLPGFGVCGFSGIILTLGSLALVAYGHWPRTGSDWVGLTKNLGPIGLSLMAAVVCALLLARYLPNIPFANRLLLKPQVDDESGVAEEPDSVHAALASLLGAIGVAATPLRPAGKVQFGEQFVDVVAEGAYVPPGTRVQVIEIEGNRVVVKQV